MSRAALVVAVAVLGTACGAGLGQDCSEQAPCPDGLVCNRPSLPGGAVSTLGVCDYPLRPEGAPCTRAAECESTLTCSNHFAPGTRYGTCVQKRAAGEACFVKRDCVSNVCRGASGFALDGICQ